MSLKASEHSQKPNPEKTFSLRHCSEIDLLEWNWLVRGKAHGRSRQYCMRSYFEGARTHLEPLSRGRSTGVAWGGNIHIKRQACQHCCHTSGQQQIKKQTNKQKVMFNLRFTLVTAKADLELQWMQREIASDWKWLRGRNAMHPSSNVCWRQQRGNASAILLFHERLATCNLL